MKTIDERLQELQKQILSFEKHIQATKVTATSLKKAQDYLDGLEKEFPASDRSTNSHMLFHMYELQALIDTAKGNVRRAKAFISEARDLLKSENFYSETIQDLAGMAGHAPKDGDKIDFFIVSGWRLFFMNVLTLGLYTTYWFYKNWKAVEAATGRKQHAVLSAIFAAFFSYSLFRDLKAEAGEDARLSPGWRALGFFVFGFLALFHVQDVMEQTGSERRTDFQVGETVVLLLGVLYWAIVIFSSINSNTTSSTRGAFMESCTKEASSSSVFSATEADNYCGCVYDKGVDRFGKHEFLSKADAIEASGDLTPELQDLVTECVNQVQSI